MTEELDTLRAALGSSKKARHDYILEQLGEMSAIFSTIMDAKATLEESMRSLKSLQIEFAQPALQSLRQSDQDAMEPYSIASAALKESIRKDQANRQRAINSKIVKLLRTDLSLPVCIRLVGHLKEQQRDSNSTTSKSPLPRIFLQARETFFQESLLQSDPVEALPSHPVLSFDRTMKLMRGPFVDIISQYYAIFEDEPAPLYDFVAKHMSWFFEILEEILKQPLGIAKMPPFWNELAALNDALSVYSGEFMGIAAPMLVGKAIRICCERFDKAVGLFLGSVSRMTKIAAEVPAMKSIPPFVLLCNVLDDAFRDAGQLPVALLRDRIKGEIRVRLEPIEKCLREGGEKTQRLHTVFQSELLPYIDDHIARLNTPS